MGVSINQGPLFGSPDNVSRTRSGAILGPLIFGNSQTVTLVDLLTYCVN